MDIYLVRHGEAAASWGKSSDPGLSELGTEQARESARQLLPQLDAHTALVSSPLARAQQTAVPLALALSSDVIVNDAFSEIPAPVPLRERQAWLRQFMQQRWDEQPPNLHEWRERACTQLLALRKPSVVFTHFLVINAVLGRVLGRAETLCFWPDNASITHLRRNGDALELIALGREMDTVVN
jgi:probable phosphoglycerate mutase